MSLVHEALEKAERERSQRREGAPYAKKKVAMEHSTDSSGPPSPEITLRLKRINTTSVYSAHAKKSRLNELSYLFRNKKRLVVVALSLIVCLVFFLLWNEIRINPPGFDEGASSGRLGDGFLSGTQGNISESEYATRKDEKAFRLSGIMADPEGTFCAVLNGFIVYPGEKIPGGTIREITREAVRLDTPGRSIELRLN